LPVPEHQSSLSTNNKTSSSSRSLSAALPSTIGPPPWHSLAFGAARLRKCRAASKEPTTQVDGNDCCVGSTASSPRARRIFRPSPLSRCFHATSALEPHRVTTQIKVRTREKQERYNNAHSLPPPTRAMATTARNRDCQPAFLADNSRLRRAQG